MAVQQGNPQEKLVHVEDERPPGTQQYLCEGNTQQQSTVVHINMFARCASIYE